MKRTHHCNELRPVHIGQIVTLDGWVHSRRDLGGLIFIDVRDREGLLQVVFDPEQAAVFKEAERLRNEFVIRVTGQVRARPAGTVNANLASGQVELLARELEVLNRCEPLPFQLDEHVGEEVRLRYRYLDLRREVMSQRLRLRHRITRAMRGFLDAHGFIDLETPMLTKATPEGARDYLVLVPRRQVVQLDMSVDEAMRMIITCGVVVPHHPPAAATHVAAEKPAA